jgi:hypothetical protein
MVKQGRLTVQVNGQLTIMGPRGAESPLAPERAQASV